MKYTYQQCNNVYTFSFRSNCELEVALGLQCPQIAIAIPITNTIIIGIAITFLCISLTFFSLSSSLSLFFLDVEVARQVGLIWEDLLGMIWLMICLEIIYMVFNLGNSYKGCTGGVNSVSAYETSAPPLYKLLVHQSNMLTSLRCIKVAGNLPLFKILVLPSP